MPDIISLKALFRGIPYLLGESCLLMKHFSNIAVYFHMTKFVIFVDGFMILQETDECENLLRPFFPIYHRQHVINEWFQKSNIHRLPRICHVLH